MKLYKLFLCITIFCLSYTTFSQKQNDNWFFGKYVGINFNPSASNGYNLISGSQMEALAGSAVMSDPITGQLLFYTDGRTIWNKNHAVMNNGSGLRGSPSSAQPAIVVPKPGSNTIYYVFTMSGITEYLGLAERKGLAYSIVDMSLNSGLGGVTTKNVVLFSNSDTEMLTSTLGHDGSYYWVVTQKESNFLAYKVSATGINTAPVTSAALYSALSSGATNGIKISPNSEHLAVRHKTRTFGGSTLFLYNFNNTNGQITNGINLYIEDDGKMKNGIEFSPDSELLYSATDVAYFCCPNRSSIFLIKTSTVGTSTSYQEHIIDGGILSLQRSFDNKIYVSSTNNSSGSSNYISVIDNPNFDPWSSWISYDLGTIINSNRNDLSSSTHKIHKGFPQLVYLNSASLCEENLFITQPITSSQDFQVSNKIEASSVVYQNFNVNFRASQIILKPGFSVSGYDTGVFKAVIDPCSSGPASPIKEKTNFKNDELTFEEPLLFPNPTKSILNIDNIEDMQEWKLVDIYGKTFESGKVNNSIQTKITINTSRLLPGVYYFNAVMKNGELFQKTVMKK